MTGTPLIPGAASGPLLVTDEPLSFWGGYDPLTGEIIDRRHPLSGRRAAGCVLAMPFTRGSSTTTAILLESVRRGTAPAALITTNADPFLVLAAVVAEELYGKVLPIVSVGDAAFRLLREADTVQVHADGRIE